MNIYVCNLSPEVNEEDIDELFSIHCKVSKVMVILHRVNKTLLGILLLIIGSKQSNQNDNL